MRKNVKIFAVIFLVSMLVLSVVGCQKDCGGKHTWGEGVVTKEATCAEAGSITYTCSVCGEVITETIPQLQHVWDEGYTKTPSTCNTEGEKVFTCTLCGETKSEKLEFCEHSLKKIEEVEAKCSKDGMAAHYECTVCNALFDLEKNPATSESLKLTVSHTYGAAVVTKEATCSAEGVKQQTCLICGDVKTETIPKTEHTVVVDKAVSATCEKTGLTEGKHCSVCDEVLQAQEEIPMLEHKWGNGYQTKIPTCTKVGEATYVCSLCGQTKTEQVPKTEHSWDEGVQTKAPTCSAVGEKTYTCTDCSATKTVDIPTVAHSYGEWVSYVDATCEKDGEARSYCAFGCGNYIISKTSAVGHKYLLWTQTSAPTCEENGVESSKCQNCGNVATREVASTGHNLVIVLSKSATCSEQGNIFHWHCSYCDRNFEDYSCEKELSDVTVAVDPDAHSWGGWTEKSAATCSSEQVTERACALCGKTETKIGYKIAHNYVTSVVAPTCVAEGYTLHTCSMCGDSYKTAIKDALGHTLGELIIDRAATCSLEGKGHQTCSVCHIDVTTSISKTEHNYGETKVVEHTCLTSGFTYRICLDCGHINQLEETQPAHRVVIDQAMAPTCAQNGLTEGSHCGLCGEILVAQTSVPATGEHQFVEYAAKAATCTEKGWKGYHVCSVCGTTTYEEVSALGHAYGEWTTTKAATCSETGIETRVCAHDASHIETREIAKIAHAEEVIPAVAATCTKVGLTEGKKCSVCGTVLVAQNIVSALGHDYVDHEAKAATCTEIGWEAYRTCSHCDYSTYKEISAKGHTPGTEATCTTPQLCTVCKTVLKNATGHDYVNGKCSVCGAEDVAHEHTYDDGKTLVFATCESAGTKIFTCSVCGATKIEDVAALGHDYVNHEAKAATCEEKGWEAYQTCSRCEYSTYKEISAKGHNWSDWTVSTMPECEKDGQKSRACEVCGEIETQKIVSFGHAYKLWEGKDATCTESGLEDGFVCATCGEILVEQKVIPAKGHVWNKKYVVVDSEYHKMLCEVCQTTITEDGTESDAVAHTFLVEDALNCSKCDWHNSSAAVVVTVNDVETYFETFSKAVENIDAILSALSLSAKQVNIKLLADVTEPAGLELLGAYDYVLDLNGKTYTVTNATTPVVGRKSAKSAASHVGLILSDEATLEVFGGSIVVDKNNNVYVETLVLQQNNLTLTNVTLDVSESSASAAVALSNIAGTTTVNECVELISKNGVALQLSYTGEKIEFVYEISAQPTVTGKVVFGCETFDTDWVKNVLIVQKDSQTGTETSFSSNKAAGLESSGSVEYADFNGGAESLTEDLTPEKVAHVHSWSAWKTDGENTHTRQCEKEGCDETETANHDWIFVSRDDATCTENGTNHYKCSVCGETKDETIAATGHTAGEWIVTLEPTCTAKGSQHKLCAVCNAEVQVEEIDALGHDYKAVVTAPTCTEKGYTTHTCSRCNDTYTDSETAATGHSWGEPAWNWSEDKATCSATFTCKNNAAHIETVNATVTSEVTEKATCTETGVCTHTAAVTFDGKNFTATATTQIDATGHTEQVISAVVATCTKTGLTEGKKCSVCGTVLVAQNIVPALGHDYKAVVTAPTCTEKGYTTHTCSRCNDTYTDSETAATGHSWGEPAWNWSEDKATCSATFTCKNNAAHIETVNATVTSEVTEKATCTETGVRTHTAAVTFDGKNFTDTATTEIDATGHTEEVISAVAATCTKTGLTEGKKCSVCGTVLVEQKVVPMADHNYVDGKCSVCGAIDASHEHRYGEGAVTKAATCERAGEKLFTCSICGITKTEEIPATGHAYGEWTTTKAATCTETGDETRVCSHDASHIETRELAKIEHTEEVIPAVAATCAETGLTAGKKCSVCGTVLVAQEVVPALGHDYVDHEAKAATCTEKGWGAYQTCSRCDYTTYKEIPATGHTESDWTVTKSATCAETGSKHKVCVSCGIELATQTIDLLEHSYGDLIAEVSSSCTHTGTAAHYECSVCKKLFVDENGAKAEKTSDQLVIAKKDHIMSVYGSNPATCVATGNIAYYKCLSCGGYFSDSLGTTEISDVGIPVDPTAHDYKAVVTAPTCTEKGYTTHTCSRCGDTYTDSENAATGHTAGGEWIVTKSATCTEAGSQHKLCAVCNAEAQVEEIPALGHAYGEWTTTKAATCTETGVETRVCSHDASHTETRELAKIDHTVVADEAVDATCTTAGKTSGSHCSVCGTVLVAQEVVPALGHNWNDNNVCERCNSVLVESVWSLVTDVSSLKAGDQIVIVASEYDAALSTTQNSRKTNWTQTEIVKTNDGKNLSTPSAQVQIFVLEVGTKEGTFAFNVGEKYLYAAGSNKNNYLKTQDTLNDNGSWKIVIDENGIATIIAQGDNTNNRLQYNSSNKLFSCYASGQQDVSVYKLTEVVCASHGAAEGAEWFSDGAQHWHICDTCGKKVDVATHTEISVAETPATCTQSGQSAYTKCSVCEYHITKPTEIPAKGHNYVWKISTEPTTTAVGAATGACDVCGEATTVTLPALTDTSVWTKSTVTPATHTSEGEDSYTSTYGTVKVTTPKLTEHSYTSWKITTDPTTTSTGLATGTCVCGEAITAVLPVLTDTSVWTKNKEESVAVTCTINGKDVYNSTYGTVEVVLSATGHKWSSEWSHDETNHWHVCSVCGETKDSATHTFDQNGTCECGFTAEKGSLNNPLTVAEALEILNTTETNEKVYVQGVVESIEKIYNDDANIWITDESGAKLCGFYIYWGDSEKTTVYVNDEVVIYGYLQNYTKNNEIIPEITGTKTDHAVFHKIELGTSTITVTVDDATHATVTTVDGGALATSEKNGDTITFKVTATEGYKVASVKVNGADPTENDDGTYSATVTGPTTIEITTATEGTVTPTTVTKTIKDLATANGWTNGTQVNAASEKSGSFAIDSVITFNYTTTKYYNTGKYYSSDQTLRIYQNESPTFGLEAAEGYEIVSVKITYSTSKTGIMKLNGENVESGTLMEVNASSITFGVGNTGTATNGQVQITNIEVVYKPVAVCDHTNAQAVAATDSTCEKQGNIAYWYCPDCKNYYSDEACTEKISLEDTVKPLADHTYGALIAATASTCKEAGIAAHYECSVCGKLFDENKAEKTADELKLPLSQTHTPQADSYSHVENSVKHTYICSVCNETVTEDCVDSDPVDNKCDLCNAQMKETTEPIKVATITFDDISKRSGESGNYAWKENNIIVETESTNEYYNPIRIYANETFTINYNGFVQIVIYCNETSHAGSLVDSVGSDDKIDTTQDNKVVTIKFKENSNSFNITVKKQVRIYSIEVYAVAAEEHEHTYGDWTITTNPTVTDVGEATRSCTVSGCSEKQTATVSNLSDTSVWEKDETSVAATCTEGGKDVYTSAYGTVEIALDALGHIDSDNDGVCDKCKAALVTTTKIITFNLGESGSGDGSESEEYTESSESYTLNITNASKMYVGAKNKNDKSTDVIKLGIASASGSFDMTVTDDVKQVKIYVANYNVNKAATVTVTGGSSETQVTLEGTEYVCITVDIAEIKTLTISSNKYCYIDKIEWVVG